MMDQLLKSVEVDKHKILCNIGRLRLMGYKSFNEYLGIKNMEERTI